ncbi:MAG TPA: tetratricopeptide repeat protein [Fulvivirga sp.]|nr:tetratricopeptide repeat protein [Fulvivirga sp.]
MIRNTLFLLLFILPFLVNGKIKQSKLTSEEKIDQLHNKAFQLWLNYPDSAMAFVRESYDLSVKLNDKALISKSLRYIGAVVYYQGEYDSVIYYCTKSYNIAFEIRDSTLMNNALNNIGLANYNLGSYQSALEYLLRSLNMKRAQNEKYGLSITVNNIGLVYDKLKDYKQARSYFIEALEIAKRQEDKNLILYSQNNIALTYIGEGNLSEAEKYYRMSMDVDIDNKVWKSVTYCGLGQVYQLKNKYDESRRYFRQSLSLRKEVGDKRGISEILYFQSNEYKLNAKYDSALFLLDKSQKLAEEIGAKDRIFENYALYVNIYSIIGNHELAFNYQTKLLNLRDTLFNENMARNLSDIKLKIQEEENLRQMAIKEKQIEKNKSFVIFLITVIILVVFIAVLTFYQVKVNLKKNKMLAIRNHEISDQKEKIEAQKESLVEKNRQLESAHRMIRNQNEQLEKYNKKLLSTVDEKSDQLKERNDQLILANLELDNFIYKSSHDIKGPLATLLGVCNVALMDITEEVAREYFQMLYDTAQGLNSILERLKTISDISSLELKFKLINFSEIINTCVDQNRKIEGDEDINVALKIPDELKFYSDVVLLDLIFFNIIQSVMKMRDDNDARGDIQIQISSETTGLLIDVIDEGGGANRNALGDVFELFAKNALQHRSLGLGLYIVKQSVMKLGGTIILLDDNSRTHFKITLPLV